MRSTVLNALAGLVLACAMVACGGGQSGTNPTPTPTPTPTPAPTPTPTPLAAGIYQFAKSPDSFTQSDGSGKLCAINTATETTFNAATNIAVDPAGRLFTNTTWLNRVVVTGFSTFTSICGSISSESSSPLQTSNVDFLQSNLAFAKNGKLVASTVNVGPSGLTNVVAEIDPTLPGIFLKYPEKLLERQFVIAADGTFYSSDGFILRKTTPSGVSTILAGAPYDPNVPAMALDGTGPAARFGGVIAIAVSPQGDIYVADKGIAIRKISSAGVVSTIAGSLTDKGALDGPGSSAKFSYVNSIVVDSAGSIFAADGGNHAIRKITPQGVVSTVAGKLGTSGYSLGNLPGLLNGPQGLAIDGSDLLYLIVSTTLNSQPAVEILKIKL